MFEYLNLIAAGLVGFVVGLILCFWFYGEFDEYDIWDGDEGEEQK